jgi:CheY-like chemotaxis protein
MSSSVAVFASTHLVRQSIAQSLEPLGFRTHDFADLAELVRDVNQVAPRLVVMDVDGLEGRWRALAGAMKGSPQRVALVLLAGRFGFEEAHEALALGVAGMILKPFRKEEHTARLVELWLKTGGLRPRRGSPRFIPPEQTAAYFRYPASSGEQRAAVIDLSLQGLGVRPPAAGERFAPGTRLGRTMLELAAGNVPLSTRVIHRSAERMGLQVQHLVEGRAALARVVEAQHARAFGAGGKRSRW